MPLILLFFTLLLDQSSTNDPTFSQVSLCCPSISLSLFGAGGVQLISRSVSTLGRVVAHWRGLSRVARVSPCAAQPPTAGSRRAGTGTETSRVSASAPLESGHSRDTGQGTVGEPLAAAAAATLEAAPSITSCCWVPCSCSAGHQAAGQLRVSLVSTEDHHPATQLSLWLAPLPSHPDRARWRKLHSFRQRGLVISIMPVISARSGSSIRARGSAVFPKEDSDCFMRWPVLTVEALGEGLHPHGHITLHPTPKPRQATTEEYHHKCLITIIGRVLLII